MGFFLHIKRDNDVQVQHMLYCLIFPKYSCSMTNELRSICVGVMYYGEGGEGFPSYIYNV